MSSDGRVGMIPARVRPPRSRRLIRSHGSRVAQVEEVWVAPAHLPLQAGGHLVGGELAALLGDHQLEGQVEEEIAQLLADRVRARPRPSAWSSSSTSSTR